MIVRKYRYCVAGAFAIVSRGRSTEFESARKPLKEGNPVGYYAPSLEAETSGGRTLVLAHKNVPNPKISDTPLEDDYACEADWDGKIV